MIWRRTAVASMFTVHCVHQVTACTAYKPRLVLNAAVFTESKKKLEAPARITTARGVKTERVRLYKYPGRDLN